jgi:hypothetical protein
VNYSFDFFVAHMKCFNCGQVSPADDTTDMQTYIREEKTNLDYLTIGTKLGSTKEEIDGYLKVSSPNPDVTLLDTWDFPNCGYRNWARIKIVDELITSIDSVEFNRETLSQANFVSRNAAAEAMTLSGKNYETVLKNGILETLERYFE